MRNAILTISSAAKTATSGKFGAVLKSTLFAVLLAAASMAGAVPIPGTPVPITLQTFVVMLAALMLGDRFSILTMASRWKPLYKKALDELGLHHKCASVRAIEVPPDNQGLLSGKEDAVFPLLEAAARLAIEIDGAEVLILGSTTMHQAHAYLEARLPVPVINPGPLSYKMAEAALGLGLRQSRQAYPKPMHPRLDMLEAMMTAAQQQVAGKP